MEEVKKKSISLKIITLLLVFSLLLGVCISLFSFLSTRDSLIEFHSEKTEQTLDFIQVRLNGDEIKRLTDFMKDAESKSQAEKEQIYQQIKSDPYYHYTMELLYEVKSTQQPEGYLDSLERGVETGDQQLAYLYIFVPFEPSGYEGNDQYFRYLMEAMIDPEREAFTSQIGERYDYSDTEYMYLVPDLEAKQPSKTPILAGDDFFGKTLSAWTPILDSQGQVVAVIEADVSLDYVYEILFSYIVVTVLLILLIIAIAVSVLYYMTRKIIIGPIHTLNNAVFQYASGDELSEITNEIFTGDEIQTLSESFQKMAGDIHRYMVNLEQVTKEREKVETELNVAKRIQESMLPSVFPPFPDRNDFDIYAIMNPAKEVGGDFYDFFMIGEDKVAFVMADVSGKGVPAALFMMIAKGTIKNFALLNYEADQVFELANDRLNEGNDTFMFVTAFIAILDLKTGVLTYANAGHNPPLIRKKEGQFQWLDMHKNQILAVMPGAKFPKQSVQLEPGDMLFTYTDGVTEAISDTRAFYGEPRLEGVLNQIEEPDYRPIEDLVMTVRRDIDDFANGAEQADDITILLFKYM